MIVQGKKKVISSSKQQIASLADCWKATFPFELSSWRRLLLSVTFNFGTLLCQQVSEIVLPFTQIYASSHFPSPGFLWKCSFFRGHWCCSFITADNEKSHMNSAQCEPQQLRDNWPKPHVIPNSCKSSRQCLHLACRWTSVSSCSSRITFTTDEKEKHSCTTFVGTSPVYCARTTYLHMSVAGIYTTWRMAIKFWILFSYQGQLYLKHQTTPMEDSLQL